MGINRLLIDSRI